MCTRTQAGGWIGGRVRAGGWAGRNADGRALPALHQIVEGSRDGKDHPHRWRDDTARCISRSRAHRIKVQSACAGALLGRRERVKLPRGGCGENLSCTRSPMHQQPRQQQRTSLSARLCSQDLGKLKEPLLALYDDLRLRAEERALAGTPLPPGSKVTIASQRPHRTAYFLFPTHPSPPLAPLPSIPPSLASCSRVFDHAVDGLIRETEMGI